MADGTITLGADASAFFGEVRKIKKSVDTMSTSITARMARVGQAFTGLQAIGGAIFGAMSGIWSAIEGPAAEFERLSTAFEVLLGGASKASAYVEQLNAFAAKTPFALQDIASAAKTLLSQTDVGPEKSLGVIQRLGDVASATGHNLDELAQLYAKAANAGVTNEIAESFERAGVPMRKMLAEMKGVSFADVFKGISERQFGLPHLDAVLAEMTGPGGKLAGMTEKIGGTYEGLMSTLGDNWTALMREMGSGVLEELKPTLSHLSDFMGDLKPVFRGVGRALASVAQTIGNVIHQVIDWVKANKFALSEMGRMFTPIGEILKSVFGSVANVLDWLRDKIMYFFDAIQYVAYGLAALIDTWSYDKAIKAADEWQQKKMEKRERRRVAFEENERREREEEETRKAMEAASAPDPEAEKKAAIEQMQAYEKSNADQKAAEVLKKITANWEKTQRAETKGKMSVDDRRAAVQRVAASYGAGPAADVAAITMRIEALGRGAGGLNAAEEMKALVELRKEMMELDKMDEKLAEDKKARHAEMAADLAELQGDQAAAQKLREEEAVRKRINELTREGVGLEEARATAMTESKIRQMQAGNTPAKRAFIQQSGAASGSGGVSIRIGGLTEARKTNQYLKEIKDFLRDNLGHSQVATLAV